MVMKGKAGVKLLLSFSCLTVVMVMELSTPLVDGPGDVAIVGSLFAVVGVDFNFHTVALGSSSESVANGSLETLGTLLIEDTADGSPVLSATGVLEGSSDHGGLLQLVERHPEGLVGGEVPAGIEDGLGKSLRIDIILEHGSSVKVLVAHGPGVVSSDASKSLQISGQVGPESEVVISFDDVLVQDHRPVKGFLLDVVNNLSSHGEAVATIIVF